MGLLLTLPGLEPFPVTSLMNIYNPPYYYSSRAASVRPYGVLVVRSSLLAKWLREWVIRDRVRVRAGARECNTSFLLS